MSPQFWLGLSQCNRTQTVFGLELKIEAVRNVLKDTSH